MDEKDIEIVVDSILDGDDNHFASVFGISVSDINDYFGPGKAPWWVCCNDISTYKQLYDLDCTPLGLQCDRRGSVRKLIHILERKP